MEERNRKNSDRSLQVVGLLIIVGIALALGAFLPVWRGTAKHGSVCRVVSAQTSLLGLRLPREEIQFEFAKWLEQRGLSKHSHLWHNSKDSGYTLFGRVVSTSCSGRKFLRISPTEERKVLEDTFGTDEIFWITHHLEDDRLARLVLHAAHSDKPEEINAAIERIKEVVRNPAKLATFDERW